jgi:hypothetical protein
MAVRAILSRRLDLFAALRFRMPDLRRLFTVAVVCLGSVPVLATDATPQVQIEPTGGGGAVTANPLWNQPLEGLSATRERPLFSPTRRPPAPPPPAIVVRAEPAPPRAPPSVTLLGVVTDEDGARAVLRAGRPEKTMRVRVGDDVGGWKVSQIEARQVVLSSEDRTATFTLFSGTRVDNAANAATSHANPSSQPVKRKPPSMQSQPDVVMTRRHAREQAMRH